ncbi:MAG: hypothetical protein ACJAUU_001113 [Rickettsiales bacterium]|jgi:hypothetical protein
MFGCDVDALIEVSKIVVEPEKQIVGGDLQFSFDVESNSKKDQKLIIDFAVYFKKSNGGNLPKVFKLKNLTLKSQ